MIELFAVIVVLFLVFNFLLYRSRRQKRILWERKKQLLDRIYDHYQEEE